MDHTAHDDQPTPDDFPPVKLGRCAVCRADFCRESEGSGCRTPGCPGHVEREQRPTHRRAIRRLCEPDVGRRVAS